jgi:hypothetical protein
MAVFYLILAGKLCESKLATKIIVALLKILGFSIEVLEGEECEREEGYLKFRIR